MNKHAYMIMAHHRIDLLQLLINAIDDNRNDIIIHIDKKSNIRPEELHCCHSRIFFIDRIPVNWGGYSQVQCEYNLMKTAVSIGHHSYYHFLTGANFPLWNQDYIHDFFIKYNGYEFVGFDNDSDFSTRVKYYVPFSEHGKLNGIVGKMIFGIRCFSKIVQDFIGIDRRKKIPYEIKKGCAYFSITEGLINEILSKEEEMKKILHQTVCCDEVFVQTIAYNSCYRNKIYNMESEWDGCVREFAWPSNIEGEHPGCNFTISDLNFLLESNRIFAMKFESPDGISVINAIRLKRNIR